MKPLTPYDLRNKFSAILMENTDWREGASKPMTFEEIFHVQRLLVDVFSDAVEALKKQAGG